MRLKMVKKRVDIIGEEQIAKQIASNRHELDRCYLSGVINYDDFLLLDKYLQIIELELIVSCVG